MKCVCCGCLESKVIDSRLNEDGTTIRRRRECINCGKRFTTYEKIENTPIMVIKKGGNRQIYDMDKLKAGIIKACEKRPVSIKDIDRLVEEINKQIHNSLEPEISSKYIGDLVMEGLKDIDEVSYVRFASVHRQFKDLTTLLKEVEELVGEKALAEKLLKKDK